MKHAHFRCEETTYAPRNSHLCLCVIVCFTFASQPTVASRDSHMPILSDCASLLTALTLAGFQQHATGLTSTADCCTQRCIFIEMCCINCAGQRGKGKCEQEAMVEEAHSCGCQGWQGLLCSWGSPGQGPLLWTLMLLPLGESCRLNFQEHTCFSTWLNRHIHLCALYAMAIRQSRPS